MLASLDDVKTFLPRDKFTPRDGDPDVNLFQIDVERSIKGYLSSVFSSATLAAWADPNSTPAYIRACAGRLIAAYYYSKKLSEDLPDWDRTYPQRLYNEAIQMLNDVRTGQVILTEVTEPPATGFDEDFFFPRANDVPSFTKAMRW
jgi:hypothetical protein